MRDTIAAVFDDPAFSRSTPQTVGMLLFDALSRIIARVYRFFQESPPLRRIVLWAGIALVALVVARIVYVSVQRSRLAADARVIPSRAPGAARNLWEAAQHAAAAGRYTDAAHLLYAALLDTLAHRDRLHLHPSKTAGDYVRDLRARSSPSVPPFRAFVRAFEYIAYGTRECTAAEFERLRALAEPLRTHTS